MRLVVCMLAVAGIACGSDPGPKPPSTTCIAPPRGGSPVKLERAFPALQFEQPVAMTLSADGAWWYLLERAGKVWRFENDPEATTPELVLDISVHVDASGDNGLVGIAFHPQFETNGLVYLSYTRPGEKTLLESRISSFRSTDGGATLDPKSEQVVLSLEQTVNIHVNADLHFGPDGYLYAGFGDGTLVGEPYSPAVDPGHLAGTILRIDVDGGTPYAIPPDNPFVHGGGAPEVYAYGLRNPWRFTFDRETGDLWAGDVGWATWEEIDRIVPGGNYGWNTYEAFSCVAPERCDEPGLIPPVVALNHDVSRSITAGFVYRGEAIPFLQGMFVFGDFATGFVWAFDPEQPGATPIVLSSGDHAVTSFAEDEHGELYVVDIVGGTLWKLVEDGSPDVVETAAPLLSQTGCFGESGVPLAGLVPYELNWPFFSDQAVKRRWLAIPDGTTIEVGPDGHLVLPNGSVLMKEFWLGDKRVETRFLVRHDDGGWTGYTYAWRDDQRDAELVPLAAGHETRVWDGQRWHYPRRGECMQCHTAEAGRSIGLHVAQLNRTITNTNGAVVNQLEWLRELELLDALPQPVEDLPALPQLDDTTHSVADRARAWLHANCSNCHRPGPGPRGRLDFRYTASVAETGACDVVPLRGSLGLEDARIIAPGAPERSVLLSRIRASDPGWKMPPVPTEMFDEAGAAIVEQWIGSLTGCD
jgi:uncharacterized repeat protein (TIGR03806 family)